MKGLNVLLTGACGRIGKTFFRSLERPLPFHRHRQTFDIPITD